MNLKKHFQQMMASEEGFTLIEIIVVMVILAILAVLIVPNFSGRTEQARHSRAISDISNLKVALDMYEADNGNFPTTEQGLAALREEPTTDPVPENWNGPYLKDPLGNDPWGRAYLYTSPGENNEGAYDLLTYGKDGKEGGSGPDEDITSWNISGTQPSE